MPVDEVVTGATTDALPVAPALGPTLQAARVPPERSLVDGRVVMVSALAVLLALGAGIVAQLLTRLIWLVTNLAFFGRLSAQFASPADNRLGGWVVAVPVVGGLLARAVGCTVNAWPHLWHLTGTPRCFSATWQGVMQWGQWARTGTASPPE